jgi:hypothetical protein
MSTLTERYLAIAEQAERLKQRKAEGMPGGFYKAENTPAVDAQTDVRRRQPEIALDAQQRALASAEFLWAMKGIRTAPLDDIPEQGVIHAKK